MILIHKILKILIIKEIIFNLVKIIQMRIIID